MSPVSDDAELLERIRSDAPGAFEDFVARYAGRIFGFGVRMCGEREDARDVLQETLLQAYRALKELEHPEALRSWLFRVAANACLMKRRKERHEPESEVPLEELADVDTGTSAIPDPRALPDETLGREEAARRVREAIGRLPESHRVVIVLRDMEQLTTREVSRVLGIAEPAVKMRLHRARLMLRRELERAFAGGART